jgi:putative MATE family efflux protein
MVAFTSENHARLLVRFSFSRLGDDTMDPNKEIKTEIILHQDPLWKGLIRLSIPVFFVNILKTMHDLVDGFFLGKVPDFEGISISTQMQSAVGLTWAVFFIFISFGTGLSVAGNALISQCIGKKDVVGAQRYASNTILLSLILGVAFSVLLFLSTPAIMRGIGAQGAELSYAITYLRIRSFELPFLFLSYAFQAVRQSTGDTTTPVIVSIIAIVVNIILTPIMVLVFEWGIAGAAISTLIANILMTPLMLIIFMKPRNGVKIIFKKAMFDQKIMTHLLKVAGPASFAQAIQAVGFVILNSIIYTYGRSMIEQTGALANQEASALSAAYYIGNRINALVLFPASAVSSVLAIYIGQNIGARNIPRAKKAFRTAMFICVAMMTVGMLLIIPFRTGLVRLFNTDPETVAFASEYMLYLHLGLPLMGVFQTYLSTFQGSGDTKYTLIMALVRLWAIRLPLVLILLNFTDLGALGIWYAMLISNIIIVPLGMFLFAKIDFLPKVKTPAGEQEAVMAD